MAEAQVNVANTDGLATEDKQDDIITALGDSSDSMLEVASAGNFTYIGTATIASSTSAAVWKIYRVDVLSGVEILWADGNNNEDNIWDNYAALTYN